MAWAIIIVRKSNEVTVRKVPKNEFGQMLKKLCTR